MWSRPRQDHGLDFLEYNNTTWNAGDFEFCCREETRQGEIKQISFTFSRRFNPKEEQKQTVKANNIHNTQCSFSGTVCDVYQVFTRRYNSSSGGLSTFTVADFDKCLSTPCALQTNVTVKLKRLISASVDCGQRPLISVAFGARRSSLLTARCWRLSAQSISRDWRTKRFRSFESRPRRETNCPPRWASRCFTETPTLCFAFWVLFKDASTSDDRLWRASSAPFYKGGAWGEVMQGFITVEIKC